MKWQTDPESGQQVMPSDWSEFLDWLLSDDREPRTQKEWALDRGVNDRKLRRWKSDPGFVREWDRRAAELNVHPERTQSVVDALYKQAAQGDVKAASLYLQYVEKFTPKRQLIVDEAEASSLSDDALIDELEGLLDGLRGDDD